MDENQFGNTGNSGQSSGGSMAPGSTTGTTGTGSTGTTSGSEAFSSSENSALGSSSMADSGMSAGIVSVLEKFGVGENQINAVRETLKNVNIDQQLDKAKETVTESLTKARGYAKQNPGAVLAGVAVLVIGAGLLAASMKKEKD
jgi:hypothetical protein